MSENSITLFIIDSSEENIIFYQELLIPHSIDITPSYRLDEALQILSKKHFPLIILNPYLIDSEGVETFEKIYAANPRAAILVITERTEEALAIELLKLGAEDFLTLDELTSQNLERALHHSLARQYLKETLREQSFTDELTSIYNRRGFFTLAEKHWEYAIRQNVGFNLFLMDLDHLKEINDTYGHPMGDIALMGASLCLQETFRKSDILGRIGGDEFAALAPHTKENAGPLLVSFLKEEINQYNEKKMHPFELSLSVGFVYFDPKNQESVQSLVEKADRHLYENKRELLRRPKL